MSFFGFKKDKKTADPSGGGSDNAGAAAMGAEKGRPVLLRPVVTEKALGFESQGKYVFDVAGFATKTEVKNSVARVYGVRVAGVNMVAARSKLKSFRGSVGYRRGHKRAIVELRKGERIETAPRQ